MSKTIDTDGTNDDDVEHLIEAAAEHGRQSEDDFNEEGVPHAVGDLESMLRSCWEVMSAEMRAAVFAEHRELIDTWQT